MPLFSFLKSLRRQSGDMDSFIGGKPRLPLGESLPECELCGARQTFFFQISLSRSTYFTTQTMAVFACTSCVSEECLIPDMLRGPLKGLDIPSAFLRNSQKNFRVLLFPTTEGKVMEAYEEAIVFKEIVLDLEGIMSAKGVRFGKVGGTAQWLLSDGSPGLCDGKGEFEFLVQLDQGYRFEKKDSAPDQAKLIFPGFAQPKSRYYQLFIGNAIYFFGTPYAGGLAYLVPQV